MSPYLEIAITAAIFLLGLFLGLFIDKLFAIIAVCFPIPLIIYGIRNDREF